MLTELSLALNNKPNYLYFMVTSRCNAFCDFCWNWENVADAGKLYKPGAPIKRQEMSLAEIEKMTLRLPEMLLVDLFGGEPFVREELDQIIALFVRNTKVKYISIPTNGFYTEKILKDVEKSLVDFPQTFFRLYVSIDGPPLVHNKIRKLKDGYRNAMASADGLIALKKKYKNLSVSCNVNYNKETAPSMKAYIDDLLNMKKFDAINLNLVRGKLYDPQLLDVNYKEYFELQKLIKAAGSHSDQPFSPVHKAIEKRTTAIVEDSVYKNEGRKFNCFAVRKISVVSDTGDVFACEEMLDNKIGNLRDFDYNLSSVLTSAKGKELKNSIMKKECNCRWECAINTSSVFDYTHYPKLATQAALNMIQKAT